MADVDCSLAIVACSELPRVVPSTAVVTTFPDVVASPQFPVDSVIGDNSGASLPASLDVSWLVANKAATVLVES